ncbi:flagellar protein FlgN [Ferrimonas marina]|uniref:Flagella synthesis protein FlgN n=1 Tax=Ferrimonas marina TaxID=299255 RepID=A0A1M5R009_9GAMM|nr:flagellar protein FlgN [Ferrimonas marina]SHH19767.1 flagella synthesis protein FlgN [Ferrimonas marina]
MVSKRERLQILVREIRQDIEDYKQLRSLLRHQRELLQRRDSQALEQHNPRQNALCQTLARRAKRRGEILESLGVSADNGGMDRLIKALAAQSQKPLLALWQQLGSLVKECQLENEVNGKLLANQKALLDRVLNVEQANQLDYGQPA